jgi:hypothetical protein
MDARSEARNVFDRFNNGIVGLFQSVMNVRPSIFCVCVVPCRPRLCDGLTAGPRNPTKRLQSSYFRKLILSLNTPEGLMRKAEKVKLFAELILC